MGVATGVTSQEELNGLALRLRRYARALTQASPQPNEAADELVHATLARIRDMALVDRKCDVKLVAFAQLVRLARDHLQECRHQQAAGAKRGNPVRGDRGHEFQPAGGRNPGLANRGLLGGLANLGWDEREALLLVVVEQFSYMQATQILHVSRAGLVARLVRARARLAAALAPTQRPETATRRGAHLRLVK